MLLCGIHKNKYVEKIMSILYCLQTIVYRIPIKFTVNTQLCST